MSQIEEAERTLAEAIADMRRRLAAFQPQVAAAMADEQRLQARLETESQQSRAWEQRAMLAVRAGDDRLAKEALLRKAEVDRAVADLRTQYESQRQAASRLR